MYLSLKVPIKFFSIKAHSEPVVLSDSDEDIRELRKAQQSTRVPTPSTSVNRRWSKLKLKLINVTNRFFKPCSNHILNCFSKKLK